MPTPYIAKMQNLVTRFHLLLFGVTIAISGVALFNIPADYVFAAHWTRSEADWTWPLEDALATGPVVQIALMAAFWGLGRLLTKNHFSKVEHLLQPALTLLLSVIAGCQMGLLALGIGSDFDFFRITAGLLVITLLVLAVVLFEAERHSYAGMRMPWRVGSDRAWAVVHKGTALATAIAAVALAASVWFYSGPGPMVVTMAAILVSLPVLAALLTLVTRRL